MENHQTAPNLSQEQWATVLHALKKYQGNYMPGDFNYFETDKIVKEVNEYFEKR